MKNLLLVLLPALILFSCESNSQKGNFQISGTIENGAGKQLVLSQIGSRSVNPLDTVTIENDGSFGFGKDIESGDFFMIQLLGAQEAITLIGDVNVALTVTTDANNFGKEYTVEGSKDSKLLLKLNDKLDSTLAEIQVLTQRMRAIQNDTANAEELRAAINNDYKILAKGHEEFLKKFIDENPSSMASLIALSHSLAPRTTVLNVRDHKDYFNKVDKGLLTAHPNSQAVISLHEYMQQVNNPKPVASSIAEGAIAPEISLPTPTGKVVNLSSTRGNYVLLDFWAGWCRPCRMESPNLVKNYNKYSSKGFDIYQVSLDKTKEQWTDAIKADGLNKWKHVSDIQFWQSEAARLYNIRSIPANYLLDPEGKIIASNLRGPALEAKLKEIYGF